MPRDGSYIYSKPFPDTVPDTTIESTVYNGFVNDVATDLNTPRPIVAGGTGANNAYDAMIALSGEVAKQVVTNYDSFPFVSGSFYSAAGATSAPTGNAFSGICYTTDTNNMVVEARDSTTGTLYVRRKTSGTWGAWAQQVGGMTDLDAAYDARYVNVTGDTMTGHLVLPTSPAADNAIRKDFADATYVNVTGDTMTGALTVTYSGIGAPAKGTLYLGSSASVGLEYDATLNLIGAPAKVTNTTISGNASTGALTVAGGVGITGRLNVGANISSTTTAARNDLQVTGPDASGATLALSKDGVAAKTWYLGHASGLGAAGAGENLVFYSGTSGPVAILKSAGGDFSLLSTTNSTSAVTGSLTLGGGLGASGNIYAFRYMGTGHVSRQGESGAATIADVHNHYWSGSFTAYINNTNIGNVTLTSDYRVKKDVIDLPGMWDTVKGLRPIKYTRADYTPQNETARRIEMVKDAKEKNLDLPYAKEGYAIPPFVQGDSVERWGFIAHELQNTLTPSVASGIKDDPDAIQALNIDGVVAALTKALQEAMLRIEALEAR